jgi:hypothetical protein
MQKRRRVLLAIGLLLLGAGLTAVWLSRKNNGVQVELRFIGFTNELLVPIAHISLEQRYLYSELVSDSELGPDDLHTPAALLLATNTGSVSAEVRATYRPGGSGFVPPLGRGLPRVLKPGESVIVYANIGAAQIPWWTEYSYERHGLREKLRRWLSKAGSSSVQGLLNDVLPSPGIVLVKCGPITNQPPFDRWWLWSTSPNFIEPGPSVRLLRTSLDDL